MDRAAGSTADTMKRCGVPTLIASSNVARPDGVVTLMSTEPTIAGSRPGDTKVSSRSLADSMVPSTLAPPLAYGEIETDVAVARLTPDATDRNDCVATTRSGVAATSSGPSVASTAISIVAVSDTVGPSTTRNSNRSLPTNPSFGVYVTV